MLRNVTQVSGLVRCCEQGNEPFGSVKCAEFSCLAERMLASQGALLSMELR